jgi:hypothetical protein
MKDNQTTGRAILILLATGSLLVAGLACGEGGDEPMPAPIPASELTPNAIEAPPTRKGERLLGIDVTEAEDGDYDAAMDIVQSVGAEVVSLSVFWDDIETQPMTYAPNPNWLEIANAYYPARNVKLSLVISVIDTNARRLPADLADAPFDDPVVIERFKGLLDYVFSQIPDLDLTSLAIGNEIDGYLGADPSLWRQYQTFYKAASAHARARRPGLPIGTKAMFAGLTGHAREYLQQLNRSSDVIMVTYYPLDDGFTVRDPSVVAADLQALTAAYPDRPIYVLEAGYPSSADCGSSEAKQAAFVRQLFKAWDAHASQIRLLFFTWLTDLPYSSVSDLTNYYGVSDNRFAEFLRTLGLRTYSGSGSDKQALQALEMEAKARGW